MLIFGYRLTLENTHWRQHTNVHFFMIKDEVRAACNPYINFSASILGTSGLHDDRAQDYTQ